MKHESTTDRRVESVRFWAERAVLLLPDTTGIKARISPSYANSTVRVTFAAEDLSWLSIKLDIDGDEDLKVYSEKSDATAQGWNYYHSIKGNDATAQICTLYRKWKSPARAADRHESDVQRFIGRVRKDGRLQRFRGVEHVYISTDGLRKEFENALERAILQERKQNRRPLPTDVVVKSIGDAAARWGDSLLGRDISVGISTNLEDAYVVIRLASGNNTYRIALKASPDDGSGVVMACHSNEMIRIDTLDNIPEELDRILENWLILKGL